MIGTSGGSDDFIHQHGRAGVHRSVGSDKAELMRADIGEQTRAGGEAAPGAALFASRGLVIPQPDGEGGSRVAEGSVVAQVLLLSERGKSKVARLVVRVAAFGDEDHAEEGGLGAGLFGIQDDVVGIAGPAAAGAAVGEAGKQVMTSRRRDEHVLAVVGSVVFVSYLHGVIDIRGGRLDREAGLEGAILQRGAGAAFDEALEGRAVGPRIEEN